MSYQVSLPLFERLRPQRPFSGGRIAEMDLLVLDEAAEMASRHAQVTVTVADILRAASRGEILLRARASRSTTWQPCRAGDQELPMPEGSYPTLPLSACVELAASGIDARWRTYDCHEPTQFGVIGRFTRWELPAEEPALVTRVEDCRITGYCLNALADAFALPGHDSPLSEHEAQYAASVAVSVDQRVWRCEDVPHVTASALEDWCPPSDPEVLVTELRRFKAATSLIGQSQQVLTASDLVLFRRVCKKAGLPSVPEALPLSKWGEYLEAFNQGAEKRGWYAGIVPSFDPQMVKRVSYAVTVEEHRRKLKEALAGGFIQARVAGTLVPSIGGAIPLERLVLTLGELKKFAATLAIKVTEVPPREQSPVVTESCGRVSTSSGAGSEAEEADRIKRQAAGRFTMCEAAEIMAKAHELNAEDFLKSRMVPAFRSRALVLIDPKDGGPVNRDFCREMHDWVTPTNMDKWLTAEGFPYRWPQMERKRSPVAKAAKDDSTANWKMRVQAEAAACWLRLRKAGANPTRASIRPHLLKWCKENGVKTDSGINPSDGYLRTHVLSAKHWTPPDD